MRNPIRKSPVRVCRVTRAYCYSIEREEQKLLSQGKARLILGNARIRSEITRECTRVTFGVLHMGDHNVSGGVREFQGDEPYGQLTGEMSEIFQRGDFPEIIRAVDRNFGAGETYSLRLLFRDEQRKILRLIMESVLEEAENMYRRFYQEHALMMRFMTALDVPLPNRFQFAAEITLNTDLRKAVEAEELDLHLITSLLNEAKSSGVALDSASLEFALRKKLEELSGRFQSQSGESGILRLLDGAASLAHAMPFEVNLWQVQNDFYAVFQKVYDERRRKAEQGDAGAAEWARNFQALGEKLSIRFE